MIRRFLLGALLALLPLVASAQLPMQQMTWAPSGSGSGLPAVIAHNAPASCAAACTSNPVTWATYQTGVPFLVYTLTCNDASCATLIGSGGPSATGVTDSAGDTCTQATGGLTSGSAQNYALQIFKCSGGTTAGSNTVTVSGSNGTGTAFYLTTFIAQFSNVVGTVELGNSGFLTASSITGTLTGNTTVSNEVVTGICAVDGGPSGLTSTGSTVIDSNSGFSISAWYLQTSIGNTGIECHWTTGSAGTLSIAVTALK